MFPNLGWRLSEKRDLLLRNSDSCMSPAPGYVNEIRPFQIMVTTNIVNQSHKFKPLYLKPQKNNALTNSSHPTETGARRARNPRLRSPPRRLKSQQKLPSGVCGLAPRARTSHPRRSLRARRSHRPPLPRLRPRELDLERVVESPALCKDQIEHSDRH